MFCPIRTEDFIKNGSQCRRIYPHSLQWLKLVPSSVDHDGRQEPPAPGFKQKGSETTTTATIMRNCTMSQWRLAAGVMQHSGAAVGLNKSKIYQMRDMRNRKSVALTKSSDTFVFGAEHFQSSSVSLKGVTTWHPQVSHILS